ncbi:hypothetical protein D9613_003614 [Agrocybe pediades]|uniref:Dihydrofolate synthetase n=1 Tax=Agrocybe pediades TaxID=84607 RepID=A0A8H4VJL3_9AGAR|nr:hypothetical protein D9613_003614 [Agrocybe pediades]
MSIDLSLSRVGKVLDSLPYTRPTLHIAGTNGKGSVSAIVSSILLASSPPYRVGRFNSPHLVSILDCIVIDGKPVPQGVYDEARQEVQHADKLQGAQLTSFETLAMTALRVFEKANVDIVVLEVGMGGRLDATNVVPDSCILASALTAVDLDHQAFLGNTVEAIAREKAAIARPGRHFVLGKQKHPSVEAVVRQCVADAGAIFHNSVKVDIDDNGITAPWSLIDLGGSDNVSPPPQPVKFVLESFADPVHANFPLHGAHQLDNLGTALGMLDALLCEENNEVLHRLGLKSRVSPASIRQGIENVKWPGRLSFHTVSVGPGRRLVVLADGAHNAASATTLGDYLNPLFDLTSVSRNDIPITYILSQSHSPPKTPLETLGPLLQPARSNRVRIALLRFTPPEGMPWVKSVAPEDIRPAVKSILPDVAEDDVWVGEGDNSLEDAFLWAADNHLDKERGTNRGLVVLAGSLYLVADFYRLLERGGVP